MNFKRILIAAFSLAVMGCGVADKAPAPETKRVAERVISDNTIDKMAVLLVENKNFNSVIIFAVLPGGSQRRIGRVDSFSEREKINISRDELDAGRLMIVLQEFSSSRFTPVTGNIDVQEGDIIRLQILPYLDGSNLSK
jgi:hypothetical protein